MVKIYAQYYFSTLFQNILHFSLGSNVHIPCSHAHSEESTKTHGNDSCVLMTYYVYIFTSRAYV